MKLINNSEQFKMQFDGSEYTIPAGEFEVASEKLASHITFVANKWGKDVKQVPNSEILQIKQEKKEAVKPVAGGATAESLPNKHGK
jgi:hypothetical protein